MIDNRTAPYAALVLRLALSSFGARRLILTTGVLPIVSRIF
jgi:hypothetical protein